LLRLDFNNDLLLPNAALPPLFLSLSLPERVNEGTDASEAFSPCDSFFSNNCAFALIEVF
jgi:hypothetical protein